MKLSLFSIMSLMALSSWAQNRSYFLGNDLPADSIFYIAENSATVAVEARCAMPGAKEGFGEGASWWGIAWNYLSPDDYDYVILRPFNTDFCALDDRRMMSVEYGSMTGGDAVMHRKETLAGGFNMTKGFNSLLVEWGKGVMRVFAGSKELNKILDVESPLPATEKCRLLASCALDVSSLVMECGEDMVKSLATGYEMDDIMKRIAISTDPMEGAWRYLDRETDDSRARLGGNYTLLIIKSGTGYEMLYLGGARVNGAEWQPLMLKGVLSATPFEHHYDMVWYDSMMNRMDDETHATLSEEGVLSFDFPLYRSKMRFCRAYDSIR